MKSILVIGACGHVGSTLVRALLDIKSVDRVHCFDNLSSGKYSYLPYDIRVNYINGDARYEDELNRVVDHVKPDTVFHLAANPDIAAAVHTPSIDFENGTKLTRNVLEAMRLAGVKRLLYFSGSGIYGEAPRMAFREDYGPLLPISTYGASKLASEALICSYCHMFGMTARAFRFANIVGPRQTHGVGYDFLRKLKQDTTQLRILGDGSQTKSYIHVNDAIRAVLLIESEMDRSGGYDVFNVSTDDNLSVTQIAEMAACVMGLDPARVKWNYTGGDRGWKGDVPVVRFDCAKIKAKGWKAECGSRDAMWLALSVLREELPVEECVPVE